ncbi:MAG: response regulator [Nitrospirae bacterium]|nr:response regulator [Nitrospirota bacterium]
MEANKKNILIIDSDINVRRLIREIIQEDGYRVFDTKAITDAFEFLSKNKPDLIITEIALPVSSGIELVKKVRETSKTLPIIVITEHDDPKDMYEFISLGIFSCLKKPFTDSDSLKTAIKNAVHYNELTLINHDWKLTKKYPDNPQQFITEIATAKQEWESGIDSLGIIVIFIDSDKIIRRCNHMLCILTGKTYNDLLGRKWDDVIRETGFNPLPGEFHLTGGIEFYNTSSKQWLLLQIHPLFEILKGEKSFTRQIITIQPITELKKAVQEIRLQREKIKIQSMEVEEAYEKLKKSQAQILQHEKMASIGQLAAGIAHEINNPVGFITSNLNTFQKYLNKLTEFIKIQSAAVKGLSEIKQGNTDEMVRRVMEFKNSSKIDYILEDTANLIRESLDGTDRVKSIVQDLKSFSHINEDELKLADINSGINSTINIVWNELKYKATLKKEYGDIPMTKCNIGQLNQVFMNIMVNAAHAIEKNGEITIKTWSDGNYINISIKDTGCGIPKETIPKIFEPFVTTKEIGKGTGLGLSIAYDIVKRHNGIIDVESEVGKGTTFTVRIPIIEK